MRARILFSVILLMIFTPEAAGQESVFTLFKNKLKSGDEYFRHKRYRDALGTYLNTVKKDQVTDETRLKIARCYYNLGQYENTISWYGQCADENLFSLNDLFSFAEAEAAMNHYKKAIELYKQYLFRKPGDVIVTRKIWQLQNIHFLYEDSLHYALRPISSNSGYSDLCATPYNNGIVFMSNREEVKIIDHIDAASNTAFYRLYYSASFEDTITHSWHGYGKPSLFNKAFDQKFHEGPAAFYDHERKMVYAATSPEAGETGERTLQLFFAQQEGMHWKTTGAFPYNSVQYSITDPSISEDGNTLYFCSDMNGGLGGKDLYRSEYVNNGWTRPLNLGDVINTPYDEVFPHLYQNKVLYFSSNGHAGFGGLDIFKAPVQGESFGEVANMGYPVNTNYDEFGIALDSLGTHGYITSNRNRGGLNDDIYEFEMDVQTYPLAISGYVKYREFNWADSVQARPLSNAKLYLIDHLRNIMIHEYQCDSSGYFSLSIPYFSKYKIRVVGEDHEENVVSLEIPKDRKIDGRHEIVIVKDPLDKNPGLIR